MFYIHHIACISPQNTFSNIDIDNVNGSEGNEFHAAEPIYSEIPPGLLRRMGKAVRIGAGTGLEILKKGKVNGIVIGTANGGMEDCIKFLSQIIDYNEGRLTPTNFVQSTPNAVASQLALMNSNKGYNVTHSHRGLAFENALLDTAMLLKENKDNAYLVGGIDEISTYNHAIEKLAGAYKEENIADADFYITDSPGSMAGEGAAMFYASLSSDRAIAKVKGLKLLHTASVEEVKTQLEVFLKEHSLEMPSVDLFVSGENGDNRLTPFYLGAEEKLGKDTQVVRFKHMCGEFPSASVIGVWLGCHILQSKHIPAHMYKRKTSKPINNVLIYNTYKGVQHGFTLLSLK